MIQHVLEHAGIAMQRHGLKGVGEIPIIAIGSHGNASGYRRIEFRRIEPPLFARVAAEHLFVQLTADPSDDNVFGRSDVFLLLGL